MPSTTQSVNYELQQLIPPKPQPSRGKSFPLSGNEEWFIYPHGKSVYMYNTKDPKLTREYCEHAYQVKVAKLSPSGKFVASGDSNGNLRVWKMEDFKIELDMRILGGGMNDLTWSKDEKYIAVCGEGREQFANVVKADGGASFGELVGPGKACSSIEINEEFCLIGSDDKSVTIYRASPTYKFVKSVKNHENFVQSVRLSPDGKRFASAGADGKIFIYSCESFEVLQEIKAHEGGILWMEWRDEFLLSASSDKTVKMWKFNENSSKFEKAQQTEIEKDWNFEKQICGFTIESEKNILNILRLDGSIEIINLNDLKESMPTSLVFNGVGHTKGVVDLKENSSGFTSISYDGYLKNWTEKAANNFLSTSDEFFNHSAQKLIMKDDEVCAVFENKIIRKGKIEEFASKIVSFDGEGKTFVLEDGTITSNSVKMKVSGKNDNIVISAAAIKGDEIAIYSDDKKLTFYKHQSSQDNFDDLSTKITAMSFEEEGGKQLAVADEQRRIKIFNKNCEGKWERVGGLQWSNHSARIDSLCWFKVEKGERNLLASAGVDGNLIFWSAEGNKIGPIGIIKNAHLSPINRIIWLKTNLLITAGSDSCIKIWKLNMTAKLTA